MPQLGILLRQRRAAESLRHQPSIDHAMGKASEMLAFSDSALRSSNYVLGSEFTAADIMLGYTLSFADHLGLVDDQYRNVRSYLVRLLERPAFQEALAA
jgi:glutathione S-transferase